MSVVRPRWRVALAQAAVDPAMPVLRMQAADFSRLSRALEQMKMERAGRSLGFVSQAVMTYLIIS